MAAISSCSRSEMRRRASISLLSAAVLARDSAAICANAFASTPISWPPPAGSAIVSSRENPSTSLVICTSGRVSERATMMATTKAQKTATNPPIRLESRTADVAAINSEYGTA